MYLPNMVTDDGIRKVTTENFGGYNHTLAAKNGMIWDEENIVSDFFRCFLREASGICIPR